MDVPNRGKLESKLSRALGKQFASQRRELLSLLGDPPNIGKVPASFWEQAGAEFTQLVEPFLADVYKEQVAAMLDDIGVSWDQANEAAAKWAAQYTFDLVTGITSNSQATLQEAINKYFQDGLTLSDLTDSISQAFGPARAELIAITEITRAAAFGEMETVSTLEGQGFVFTPVWQTSNDDMVCEICGPLHNEALVGEFDGLFPPAHPGCRCWVNHELVTGNS